MSGIGQGRGGSQRPGRGRKTAENPSPHERHGASSPGVDSMLSQEASSTRSRSDSGTDSDAVSASTQRIATLAIDDVPPAIVADKLPPGKRQVRAYKVQTNVFGVIPPKNHPVYRYDFRVVAMFGAKSKELTKQSREDYVSVDRKDKCTKVFKHVVEKNKDFFNGLITLIYDRAAILYTATKFPVAQGAEKTIMMAPADFPSELGLDDKCTGVMVKVKPVDEFFELILDDFQSSIDNNLDKQDRSLKQFFEIATSQAAFFNGDHVTYGSGVSYLLDQNKFGFSDRDCPELCEGKYLAVGSDKSIRFVEGPNGPGNVNAVVVVDTKKAAFHKYQGVVNTITEILRLPPNRLSQLTLNPAQTRLLRTQLKDLFVETNYGGYRKFQICGISEQAARDIKFNDKEGRLISLVEYFKTAYGLVLQYPNLPCLLERKPGKGAADYSKYPMELCTIGDNQRVTQAKQTPAQMEKMIKACATLPAERLKQNERNIKALQLNNCGANNQWLANMQLRITSTSLTCPARQLPAPTAEYAGQQKVKIDNDKGTWRASDKRFYQPASVGTWVVVVLQQPGDRYNITKEDTIAFLEVYKKQCKAKGMAIGDEATIRPMDAVESAVESFFKEAQSKGVRFIFFIQNDNAHVHHKIKLCEVQYQIVTQDLMMSTAKAAPRKFQTLENIVQKTNIKLGGLNFNLLLENPAATQWITKTNRLIIGLDVSHPPPLSAQEMARGMKPKAPSVIGYAANTRPIPLEFVGDCAFQESRREEVIVELYKIACQLLRDFKASRNKLPDEVIVFRDGISDGQYKMAIQSEAPMLRMAFKEVGGPQYKPKLTVIVSQKRHNVRLIPEKVDPNDRAPDQNVPCGTILDQYIVHPRYTEFYLNSHRACQGSVKTPRYTVLINEAKMSSDELEGLTYALCFDHQIVNMAISLPAPVYIADLWATRGKNNYNCFTNSDESSDSAFSTISQGGTDFSDLSRQLAYAGKPLAKLRVNA